jgi:ribosomal protein S18
MTTEELKKYVTSNKRICPMTIPWNKFLDILEIKEKMPPHLIPLILNGWFSSDLEKRKRILAQIDYASKDEEMLKKLEEFILNIDNKDWLYGEDPLSDEEHSMI